MKASLSHALLLLALACCAAWPASAAKPEAPPQAERTDPALAGHYYLNGVMETGSELLLRADGRFMWAMTYGALDLQAQGRWYREGDRVVLQADVPATPPVFRLMDADETGAGAPPSEDAWIAVVGIPGQRALSGIEVMFEDSDRKQATFVTTDNGVAMLQPFPAGRHWTRTALRRAGRDEPWQWLDMPDGTDAQRFAGFTVVDPSAYRELAFERMQLRIDDNDLIPSWPWDEGRERGHYARE
ncbi:MAG TPA: hypothetical protein VGD21_05685 [Lysobacter sp.]